MIQLKEAIVLTHMDNYIKRILKEIKPFSTPKMETKAVWLPFIKASLENAQQKITIKL